ncbi:hypothetical protein [Dysgonomonas reticulitermitis]
MILGNSFGKNKGKKYFMRERDMDSVDCLYAEMAEDFNRWFDRDHKSVERQLIGKRVYDVDILNDTYLKIYDIVLFSGLKIKDYKSYFIRSYFTNCINGSMKENRYCELQPNFDRSDMDVEHLVELDRQQKQLEDDIFSYVYANYNLREFELFKMYVSLKPAVNYDSLAEITQVKAYSIQRIVSKIKKDIQENPGFFRRWKEVG